MHIEFVLFARALAGGVLAGGGGLMLAATVAHLTHDVKAGRGAVILAAGFSLFACLAWGGAVFALQWFVDSTVFHQDPAMGETHYFPLSNGYEVLIFNPGYTYYACLLNPRSDPRLSPFQVSRQTFESEMSGITLIQDTGRYIFGGRSRVSRIRPDADYDQDCELEVDTVTGQRKDFDSLKNAKIEASRLGIQLNLEPIEVVYQRLRINWFDDFACLLFITGPLLGYAWLIRRILQLRKEVIA